MGCMGWDEMDQWDGASLPLPLHPLSPLSPPCPPRPPRARHNAILTWRWELMKKILMATQGEKPWSDEALSAPSPPLLQIEACSLHNNIDVLAIIRRGRFRRYVVARSLRGQTD